jgi:hypothetical protein
VRIRCSPASCAGRPAARWEAKQRQEQDQHDPQDLLARGRGALDDVDDRPDVHRKDDEPEQSFHAHPLHRRLATPSRARLLGRRRPRGCRRKRASRPTGANSPAAVNAGGSRGQRDRRDKSAKPGYGSGGHRPDGVARLLLAGRRPAVAPGGAGGPRRARAGSSSCRPAVDRPPRLMEASQFRNLGKGGRVDPRPARSRPVMPWRRSVPPRLPRRPAVAAVRRPFRRDTAAAHETARRRGWAWKAGRSRRRKARTIVASNENGSRL